MFVIKNALKNLFRNKGRNILLAVIIFAMITASVVGLAINNTANAIINDYKNRFSSQVVISLSRDAIMNGETIEQISAEQYIEWGESEYLAGSVFTSTAYIGTATNITGGTDTEIEPLDNPTFNFGNRPNGPNGEQLPNGFAMATGDFILYGDYFDDFEGDDADRWITEGSWDWSVNSNNNDKCLISQDLATKNSLSVGDKVKLDVTETDDDDNVTVLFTYELEIAGIYYDNTDSFGRVNRRNEILTNFATATVPISNDDYESGITVNATYYLKDPNDLDAFAAWLYDNGLPSYYSVTTDTATYNSIVQPVVSMKSITTTFLIVVLILGGLILTVLAAIAIRERKYEIGTLRAIGMKKSKVLLGLLTEFMVITFVCTFVGFFVGYFVSQPVSDVLLDQQISVTQETQYGPGGNFNFNGGNIPSGNDMQQQARPGTEALSEMKVSFDFTTILEIFAIAILLGAVPTIVSAVRITNYEPMKILSDRN